MCPVLPTPTLLCITNKYLQCDMQNGNVGWDLRQRGLEGSCAACWVLQKTEVGRPLNFAVTLSEHAGFLPKTQAIWTGFEVSIWRANGHGSPSNCSSS